jgi:hypothetical protein
LFSRDSFVALQHRNFRLIWIGLFVSFTGSMMQNAALLWHVSLLVSPAHKGLALGLVGFVKVVPIIIFSMLSGVVADAWDRRKLMLFTQTAASLVALTLAVLTFRGLSKVWPIYALAAGGAAVAAAVAAGVVQQHRHVARDSRDEPREVTWAVRELRSETRPGQPVSTDLPIVAYLAHRQIPGQLIDTSVGRLGSGFLRPREVLRLVARARVRAVVAARLFHDYPEIERGLRARFPRRLTRSYVTVYLPRSAP